MITIKKIDQSNSKDVYVLFDKYRIFYQQSSNLDLAKSFIDDRIKSNQSVIYVAYENENPVGFTQLYPSYSSVSAVKYWILNDLYVESNYREKGIGRQLIKEAIKFCTTDGGRALFLETAKDNHSAKKLYESIGFEMEAADSYYDKYKLSIKGK